jgi:hypothetical protein
MDQQLIEDVMETYSTLNVLFSIKLGVWNLYHTCAHIKVIKVVGTHN